MKYLQLLLICLFMYSCEKESEFPPDIELPESVEFGMSEVYLNNTIEDYKPRFFEDTVNSQLIISFTFEPDFSVTNDLGFAFLPVDTGNFSVHTDAVLYQGAYTSFYQIVNNEFDGWQFDLVKADEGYFNISHLDTINQTIQGKFKVFFQVSDKNGYEDTKLPEKVKFQGVFHDTYIRG